MRISYCSYGYVLRNQGQERAWIHSEERLGTFRLWTVQFLLLGEPRARIRSNWYAHQESVSGSRLLVLLY